MNVVDVEIGKIAENPVNRAIGGIDDDRVQRLAESIRVRGVLQPLIARPGPDGTYLLIAGHRRLAAARIAGLDTLPVSVRDDLDAATAETAAIIENVQRDDLHPLDEADGYARLLAMKMDRGQIAAATGTHRNQVAARLKLTDLIPMVRDIWTEHGKLPVTGALAIAELTPHLQEKFCKATVKRDKMLRYVSRTMVNTWQESASNLLSDAPWNLDDADLVEAAGACSVCPLRFGFQRDLFDPDSELTRCGDRRCWTRKLKARVQQGRESAPKALTLDPTTYYGNDGDGKKKPFSSHQVQLIEDMDEKQKGKRRGKPKLFLFIKGKRAGQVVDGYVKPKARGGRNAAWEQEERKRKAERRAALESRLPILSAIIDRLRDDPEALGAVMADDRISCMLLDMTENWRAERALVLAVCGIDATDQFGNTSAPDKKKALAVIEGFTMRNRLLVKIAGHYLEYIDDGDPDPLMDIAGMLDVAPAAPDAPAPAADPKPAPAADADGAGA